MIYIEDLNIKKIEMWYNDWGGTMDNRYLEIVVNGKLSRLFVKKEVDMTADNVNAAIVTAASKMAIPSGIIGQEEVATYLGEDLPDEAKSLIGMGPQHVEQIIGYSVDFNDGGAAYAEYNSSKEDYDALYSSIKSLILNHEKQI